MPKKVRRILMIVLAVIFLSSAGVVIYQLFQYREGDEAYAEAEELVQLPELPEPEEVPEPESSEEPAEVYVDPYADALRNMDFSALQEVNDDVLGWILIPWTKISYPVVQGSDNSYYLNHTWRNTSSSVGAIFMDYRCSQDLNDFNTILYGHRMNNGSMFAGLKYYKQKSYYREHPVIYLTTDRGSFQYEIFSVYEGSPSGESYRLGLKNTASKQAFLDAAVEASLYDTGVTPTVNDYILTLSTCTGNGHSKRLIVHAVRRGYAASDQAEEETQTTTPAAPEEETETEPATAPATTPETVPENQTPVTAGPETDQPSAQTPEAEATAPPSGEDSSQQEASDPQEGGTEMQVSEEETGTVS